MSAFTSTFYSAIWLAPMAFAGFVLVAVDRPKAMNSLLVAYVLTCALALPLYVLVPTFDPWTTNALYGAKGLTTHIGYLYPNPSPALLTQVNTTLHWAAGSAFPSLHVAFPLVVSLVLRKHGLRVLSYVMAGMAAITALVVVYLGRHWIIDVIAAVPFALAVVALGSRVPLTVTVGPRSTPDAARPRGEEATASGRTVDAVQWLSAVFFVSGFAALLYQVVWQRTLFGIIGLNIESVTLVVTAFMLGLGTGSLVGGAVSRRATTQLPLLFAAAEVGIGLFGFFSMSVFRYVGHATLTMSSTATAATTFLTLLPPTILMGATLPLLVMNQVRVQRNVGDAVGRLYFTNTLGSAAAAGVAALLLLGYLGQEATVQCAAALNIGVGLLVYARARRSGGSL
jgi:membrane-associated phospholipid phosphatase